MKIQDMTLAQLQALAGTATGDLWTPRFHVEYLTGPNGPDTKGWHWCDLGENPKHQWRGPFKSERAAWIAACADYGLIKAARQIKVPSRPKKPTHNQYRAAAKRKFHDEGTIEVDDRAKISRPGKDGDAGVYVQAWVWVADEDAKAPA